MKKLLLAMLAAGVAVSCVAKEVSGTTFTFQVEEDVTLSFNAEPMEMYNFTWGAPPNFGMLMFMANPAPMSEEMMKPMVDMTLVQVKQQFSAQGMEVSSVTNCPAVIGDFKGTKIEIVVKAQGTEMKQYMFLLMDKEGKGWNANVTAMAPGVLEKAKAIIKSAKTKPTE